MKRTVTLRDIAADARKHTRRQYGDYAKKGAKLLARRAFWKRFTERHPKQAVTSSSGSEEQK